MKLRQTWPLLLAIWMPAQVECATAVDPTRPVNYSESESVKEPRALALSAVFVGTTNSIAVINDQFLHVGDDINGNKIMEITKSSVKLSGPGGAFFLSLFEDITKNSNNLFSERSQISLVNRLASKVK